MPRLVARAVVHVARRDAHAAERRSSLVSPREITPPKYLQHWDPLSLFLNQTKFVCMD